jgi:hypothetical protein
MYICIVTPIGHPLYFSSFYLSPFFMVVLASLSFLYSFLYRKHINHVNLLSFLLLPYPPFKWPPLSVTSFSKYCFICIRSVFHLWEKHAFFGLLSLANFTYDNVLQLCPFTCKMTRFHSSLRLSKILLPINATFSVAFP